MEDLPHAPQLPEFDPDDPVESAVIGGLVRSWPHRATVRRSEPDLDEVFESAKADFAEELIPFRDHPVYLGLDESTRDCIRAWAWIAYNKNVVDIEQHVVNPGFQLLLEDSLRTGLGDTARSSVVQAMVDEQYHTLMHLNASALTRRRRPWRLTERTLPVSLTVRRRRDAVARQEDPRSAALVTLAFTTVAETSIGAYLGLIADDETVQPVNKATVALHRRDERAHAAVTSELVALVYDRLRPDDRRILLAGMADGVAAFTAADYAVWSAILATVGVVGADEMLREVAEGPGDGRLVQDCSAIDRLRAQLEGRNGPRAAP
ncbi:diiron oxygenase [Rhodococcus spelaei]|uniref:Diiron oxygenase n=1 Tax=Rhodococcus spelaei TaxID=2546320 RepID=A0A541B822_9NOCA|nr:diiron oxygenase [Rhodococcus spelaei]